MVNQLPKSRSESSLSYDAWVEKVMAIPNNSNKMLRASIKEGNNLLEDPFADSCPERLRTLSFEVEHKESYVHYCLGEVYSDSQGRPNYYVVATVWRF